MTVERIRRWITSGPSGPSGEDGTIGWMLGMLLWWRVWAVCWMLAGGMVVAGVIPQYIPEVGWFMAYVVGVVVGGWIIRFSPKYTVEKNY